MISLKDRLRDVIKPGAASRGADEDVRSCGSFDPPEQTDANDPAEILGGAWQEAAGHRFVALLAAANRHANVLPIAHQEQLRHLPHRKRQAHHAVTAIVRRERKRRHDRHRYGQPIRGGMHLLFGKVELSRSNVLVRVELDLLETDDAGRHVYLAVRGDARPLFDRSGGAAGEGLEHRHFRVCNRIRVVVAVDPPDECLPSHEVQPLDLIQSAFDHVDGLLV